jgi:serine/threonine protein kinase
MSHPGMQDVDPAARDAEGIVRPPTAQAGLLPGRRMMPVQVACPNPECGSVSVVPEDLMGRSVRCKQCGERFTLAPSGDTIDPSPTLKLPDVPPTRPAAVPERIGRFEVRKRLGSGGFGTVYRAHDPTLHREVALKVPQPERLRTGQEADRFLQEARSAAQLHHPHIVPVFEAGVDGDRFYIASALIEGRTLAEALADGPLDYGEAARIAAELAEALDYAHARRVIHRDVKPANVLLDDDRSAHLTDFGLARLEQEGPRLTTAGAMMGTPVYMAPELASGQEAGAAADQYALGVVLYEMLTGRPPFDGPAPIVLYHAVHETAELPSTLRPGLPIPLEAVCSRAMEKDPARRYPRCQDLARDLRAWLSQDEPRPSVTDQTTLPVRTPIDQEEPTLTMTVPPPERRPRRIAWALLAAVPIVALAAMAALKSGRNPADPPPPPPPGPRRQSLEFDGMDDVAEVKFDHEFPPMITVEAVVQPESATPGTVAIEIERGERPRSIRGFSLGIAPHGRWFFAYFDGKDGHLAVSENQVVPGRRVHLVGEYAPRPGAMLWLDGKSQPKPSAPKKALPKGDKGPFTVFRASERPYFTVGAILAEGEPKGAFVGKIDWIRLSDVPRFRGPTIPIPLSAPPTKDDETSLLLDFTRGESGDLAEMIRGGTLTLKGPRWVEVK